MPRVSIIICTRNRSGSLEKTLRAMAGIQVPSDLPAELLVVDNGSTDDTRAVVQAALLPNLPVRYVHEAQSGKGYAYNTGMRQARGDIFLFTDDDVRPPVDWIQGMCRSIADGIADAVAGGVRLAPHLERSWLVGDLRGWVACSDVLINPKHLDGMIGANMAFSRRVLDKVPGFDTQLGPGALGFYDEALFSRQLMRAGYRMIAAADVAVEHHFDEDRLTSESFAQLAVRMGRSCAYMFHHWEHRKVRFPKLRLVMKSVKSPFARGYASNIPEPRRLYDLFDEAFLQQYLLERQVPPFYEKHGLIKRGATVKADETTNPTRHKLAVAAAVNDDAVLQANLLRSPMLAGGRIPLEFARGEPSAASAYNHCLNRLNADYIVFAHQDVYFPAGWDEKLLAAINQLEDRQEPWAVLGVWGVQHNGKFAGRVWCTGSNKEFASPAESLQEVMSIDEIVIVLKTASGLRFDERLPGFHFYATDIAMEARSRGLKTYVFNGPVVHNSRTVPQLDHWYNAGYRFMRTKWMAHLPLQTCCLPVRRLPWPVWKRWTKTAIRQALGQVRVYTRHGEPEKLAQQLGYELSR